MSEDQKPIWIGAEPEAGQPVAAAKMEPDGMKLMTDGMITVSPAEALRLARIIMESYGDA